MKITHFKFVFVSISITLQQKYFDLKLSSLNLRLLKGRFYEKSLS